MDIILLVTPESHRGTKTQKLVHGCFKRWWKDYGADHLLTECLFLLLPLPQILYIPETLK